MQVACSHHPTGHMLTLTPSIAHPPSRQAEVVPLAEGLMELMDEDRDDAAGFADFLRVSV